MERVRESGNEIIDGSIRIGSLQTGSAGKCLEIGAAQTIIFAVQLECHPVSFQPWKYASCDRIVERCHANGVELHTTWLCDLDERHVLQVHVAVGNQDRKSTRLNSSH